MLKFIAKNHTHRSFPTWTVELLGPAGDNLLLFAIRPGPGGRTTSRAVLWIDTIAEPAHGVDTCNCGATDSISTASLLHALELGIASSARWIAVELLKNPAPAETIEEAVDGVALWLRLAEKHDPALHTVWSTFGELGVVGVSTIPPTHAPGACWWFSCPLALVPNGQRASQEQALAVLIEHAAPWIAVALMKEIEEEP